MADKKKPNEKLRSARWFAPDDLRAFGHRSRAIQMGYAPEEWKDRPVIATGRLRRPFLERTPKRGFGYREAPGEGDYPRVPLPAKERGEGAETRKWGED